MESELPPEGGARHLAKVVRALIATPAASRKTDLPTVLPRLGRASRRALVVVLSDFLDPGPASLWRAVSRRNQVVALRVVEPREEALPNVGLVALEGSESGRRLVVDTGSRKVRSLYARAADLRRSAHRDWCIEAGIVGHELKTEDDPITPLLRVFRARADRRGRPR